MLAQDPVPDRELVLHNVKSCSRLKALNLNCWHAGHFQSCSWVRFFAPVYSIGLTFCKDISSAYDGVQTLAVPKLTSIGFFYGKILILIRRKLFWTGSGAFKISSFKEDVAPTLHLITRY